MLSLNWNILWTCIDLVIFYILMKKFVWNKVIGAMDKRQEKINNQFKDADQAVENANSMKSDYEQKLASVSEESARIIDDAKLTAKAKADRIVDRAQRTSDKMVKDARVTIDIERQEALKNAKTDIAVLAMSAATKVVGKEAANLSNASMYDAFLNDSGEE